MEMKGAEITAPCSKQRDYPGLYDVFMQVSGKTNLELNRLSSLKYIEYRKSQQHGGGSVMMWNCSEGSGLSGPVPVKDFCAPLKIPETGSPL